MIATLGQAGTASLVYCAVAAVMMFPLRVGERRVVVASRRWSSLLDRLNPGWASPLGLLFSVFAASLAVFGVRQMMARNIELVRAHKRNAELAGRERAHPVRARPARHPRPLADGHHGQGRAGQPAARRRPRAGPRRARRPRAALAGRARRRAAGRRGLPGADPPGRAGPRPQRPGRRRDRGRAAQLHRRRALAPARAVRVDGAEGVTNVIRHSGATQCTVRLWPDAAEVVDDGTGPMPSRARLPRG